MVPTFPGSSICFATEEVYKMVMLSCLHSPIPSAPKSMTLRVPFNDSPRGCAGAGSPDGSSSPELGYTPFVDHSQIPEPAATILKLR
jgi:hypothetical protein